MRRNCAMCGKKFKTSKHNKYYCSEECKLKNPRYRSILTKKKKPKQIESIADINRKALELNMTYGEYVAKYC